MPSPTCGAIVSSVRRPPLCQAGGADLGSQYGGGVLGPGDHDLGVAVGHHVRDLGGTEPLLINSSSTSSRLPLPLIHRTQFGPDAAVA
ncbi:hypothetical protein C1J01_32515 [Nonomuraea aridisoli]|uniref:Uncharacterized protein n=1 Tax=Nonomuraea aridisoli TaxID=2070368 RepID=A0A2W2FAB0_9ACTN|nr:hypothetical protein C1J01_32515 [Nonomuraea aridisoli]